MGVLIPDSDGEILKEIVAMEVGYQLVEICLPIFNETIPALMGEMEFDAGEHFHSSMSGNRAVDLCKA